MIHIYVALIVLVLIFMFSSIYARVVTGVVKSLLEGLKLISGVVLDYYNQWKIKGTLPRQNVKYKFLCFYMDV